MVQSRQSQATLDRAGRQGGHVAAMQRRRLLAATVELAYEHGVQAITVATSCERAGLSRRTFYECFDGREQCLLATFEDAVEQTTRVVLEATSQTAPAWQEQARTGLTSLLCFLDREPPIGRLLIVEALGAGPQTLEARKRILAVLIAFVDQGRLRAKGSRSGSGSSEPPPLTAEGIVGAVFSVIHSRMLERDPRPLSELGGALMAMIVQPYLGPSAAQDELTRPTVTANTTPVPRLPSDPFKDLPIRLTYRTARVLSSIADRPGASSKQIADASGIADPGQISRLLTRLLRNGLIEDTGVGPAKGMARAWTLTDRGEGILRATGQA
jgi:AcrR family transcriptional regulator